MQFPCANCEIRLRVPDHYTNPRVRCPNCGHVFRPRSAVGGRGAGGVERPRATAKKERPRAVPPPVRSPKPTEPSTQTKSFSGVIGVVIMLVALFAGQAPRLAKQFFPDPPRRKAPAPGFVDRDRDGPREQRQEGGRQSVEEVDEEKDASAQEKTHQDPEEPDQPFFR